MNSDPACAQQITRASKSNLALAFIALSADRRADITTFYAFCRIVDDIADEEGIPTAERQAGLDAWKQAFTAPASPEPALAAEVRAMMVRRQIVPARMLEIIAGVEMDLTGARFETFEDLRLYCHRVASVVGLVSIEIFGYRNPKCREYALALGLALQLTNIIRDVGIDYANGRRIYLPAEDLARFGVSEADIAAKRCDERFLALMDFEAERARNFYAEAERLLPPEDRRNMVAAEIMHRVYRTLLERMQRDRFRVFGPKYRLSKPMKLWLILRTMISARR